MSAASRACTLRLRPRLGRAGLARHPSPRQLGSLPGLLRLGLHRGEPSRRISFTCAAVVTRAAAASSSSSVRNCAAEYPPPPGGA